MGRKADSTQTCWPCRGTGKVDGAINEIVHDDKLETGPEIAPHTRRDADMESINTVRTLRNALHQIDNQDMTISELRRILFEIDNQDENMSIMALRDAEMIHNAKVSKATA